MTSTIISLIVSLLSGGAGANLLVKVLKQFDLGPIGNSIVGALGGVGGNSILGSIFGGAAATAGTAAASAGGFDIGAIVGQLAGGGVSGAIAMAVVGLIKNMLFKKA